MRVGLPESVLILLFTGAWWLVAAVSAADAPQRWDQAEGLSKPKLIHKVTPVYPEEAREKGVTSVVVLDATIDGEGAVTDVRSVKDSNQRLTGAAMNAVRQWRFEPARRHDGTPVAVVYTVTVAFKLEPCGGASRRSRP